MPLRSIRLLSTTLLAFALVNSLGADLQTLKSGQLQLNGDRVEARSSGARSRSGSFRRSSPSRSRSSSSGSSSNSPSRSTRSNPSRSHTPRVRQSSPAYPSAPTIIHSNPSVSTSTTSTTDAEDWLALVILVLIILGGIGVGVMVFYLLQRRSCALGELENNVVTVTKLQVALLAEARIQTDLTRLALEVDTATPEGMNQLLQESVLALLRSPENWTHTAVSSQTLSTREAAEQLFEQLSIAERSKFNVEALANVGGRIRRQALRLDQSESAAYIVVTLLIGTENDRPMIEQVHTAAELQTALQQIAAVSPPALAIFELLWSPQDAADSLTYDELLTEYTNLIQIA